MKIAKSAYTDSDRKPRVEAILPLLDDEPDEDDKTKIRSFKLLTNPSDGTSPKFAFSIAVLDEGASVRTAIKWRIAIDKITTGLNITDGKDKHPVIQGLLSGSHLEAYNCGCNGHRSGRYLDLQVLAVDALTKGATESDEAFAARCETERTNVPMPDINNADVSHGLNYIIRELCPYKALEKQKRFMRRNMRKPNGMKTRSYVANLVRINNQELPMLPPFGPTQSLSLDELIDILTYGIPKSWVRKMDEHDFEPLARGLGDTVAFCERMEAAEEHDANGDTKTQSSKKPNKKHKSVRNNGKSDKSDSWCAYHEMHGHSTSECETLKKIKANKTSSSDGKPAFKNKTWKRKSDDAKTYTKKELNALLTKTSKAAVKLALKKAECNAIAKRKSDSSDDDDSSKSDDDCSINMMDKQMAEVDKELAEFNFDGDKSDGEISV